MYKTASILPANIPIKMAIINMYKTILVSDIISCHSLGVGSPGRTRTSDKSINSALLYQLSYRGITDFTNTYIITQLRGNVKFLF